MLFALAACGGYSTERPTTAEQPIGGRPTAAARPRSEPGVCDVTGRWRQSTREADCPESHWTFRPNRAGGYDATEEGCGDATGTARVEGAMLFVEFTSSRGAGLHAWRLGDGCSHGDGTTISRPGTLSRDPAPR